MTTVSDMMYSLGGVPLLPGPAPFATGNWFFCDAVNGSDGNAGGAQDPLASITEAYSRMTSGHNDVAVIVGNGGTTATQRLSAQLVWAKNACHLIGMTSPSVMASRARISTAAGATANIANLISVTAQGCTFANFSLFQGVGEASTAEQLWQEAGQRNYYSRIGFGGMGSANGAGKDTSYTLGLYGASENVFEDCYFGTDTEARTAANCNVQVRKNASNVASTRNWFRRCMFAAYSTAATPVFIDANQASGMDRFLWLEECMFHNMGTALTAAITPKSDQGGDIVVDRCSAVGVANWCAAGAANVLITGAVPNGHTSGIGLAAATS